MSLKPRRIEAGDGPWALRSARYGGVVVYCLDDYAFLEPEALWIRGERTGRLVLHFDPTVPPAVRLRAGPVANDVTLASGTWSQVVHLTPEQTIDVPLPREALAPAVLAISSAAGFRPSEQPGSAAHDVRWLGVYLSWPPLAAP